MTNKNGKKNSSKVIQRKIDRKFNTVNYVICDIFICNIQFLYIIFNTGNMTTYVKLYLNWRVLFGLLKILLAFIWC